MRISDWSSDVCSSDLDNHNHPSLDMTEVSIRVLKHFFFGRVEKLSVSPAHFTPVSGQLFRFYSADCRSNSSIIPFRHQYFNESSIAPGFHLGRHLFGFHLIKIGRAHVSTPATHAPLVST